MWTPLPKGSVFAFRRNTLRIEGFVCESTATSVTHIEGESLPLFVNSPDLINPKNPMQEAAQRRRALNGSGSLSNTWSIS